MPPGGWLVRRRLRTIAVAIAAVTSLCLSVAATPAQATHRRPWIRTGEPGSGQPVIPVVYPRTSTDLATRSATRASTVTFADLDASDTWAKEAIRWVAKDHNWMRDFPANPDGTYDFQPDTIEKRKLFARSIVRAFAPDARPDPSTTLSDLDPSSRWYRYAAVAVDRGWMGAPGGAFDPNSHVTMAMAHRALVLAVGLRHAAKALDAIHTRDGVTFDHSANFGTTVLGMRLQLRYNAPTGSESMDVAPSDLLPRSQVAYSIWRATTLPSYVVPNLLGQYQDVRLPHLGPRVRRIVRWGIRYAGYPYVWGGEWGFETSEPSALGGQPRSGFDCSGLTWWLLRADDGGSWNISPPRPYGGWSLPQRTSADMASMTKKRIAYTDLEPGDIMFYDGDGDGVVDHVDTFIGNGYALDSSNSPGGVSIMWVGNAGGLYGDDWYRHHFKFGRRILPN
jgi:cell wall-associated NlpC family hydrolase